MWLRASCGGPAKECAGLDHAARRLAHRLNQSCGELALVIDEAVDRHAGDPDTLGKGRLTFPLVGEVLRERVLCHAACYAGRDTAVKVLCHVERDHGPPGVT